MNSPLIDFGKLVKEKTDENMKIYKAGHDEGYTLGYREGWTAACREAINIINAPKDKP